MRTFSGAFSGVKGGSGGRLIVDTPVFPDFCLESSLWDWKIIPSGNSYQAVILAIILLKIGR
jgi:hypothetical protein